MRPDPFLDLSNPRWDAIVADGVVELLRVRGLHELTMAALARWANVTPAAVTQRASRQATLRLVVQRLALRFHRWSVRPTYWLVEPQMPADAAQCHGVRVWTLLPELARGDPESERTLAEARLRERADVLTWWSAQESTATFEEYYALLVGLRLAMALGHTDLAPDEAQDLLMRLTGLVVVARYVSVPAA